MPWTFGPDLSERNIAVRLWSPTTRVAVTMERRSACDRMVVGRRVGRPW